MLYLFVVIPFVIIGYAAPAFLALVMAHLLACVLVVRVSARIVTGDQFALSACLKAVINSIAYSLLVGLLCFAYLKYIPTATVWAAPALLFLAQVIAYATTLGLRFWPSVGVSVCGTLLWWGISSVFEVGTMLVTGGQA
jgi:hypothetical protein